MYQSKKGLAQRNYQLLEKELLFFLTKNQHIKTKCFGGRKVFLDKLPEAILKRKRSRKDRLQCFWLAIDILKNEKKFSINLKNHHEFEILGLSKNNELVGVHIREELSPTKDKKLFFISCFYKKKTSAH